MNMTSHSRHLYLIFSGGSGQVPLPLYLLHRGGAGYGSQCPGPLPRRGTHVSPDPVDSKNNLILFCRAGTTGIICLMHFAGLESHKVGAFRYILFKHLYHILQAILTAKALRSIIQPIGDFQQLLKMCDNLKRKSDGKFILDSA